MLKTNDMRLIAADNIARYQYELYMLRTGHKEVGKS